MRVYKLRKTDNTIMDVKGEPSIVIMSGSYFVGLIQGQEHILRYAGEMRLMEAMTDKGPMMIAKLYPLILASGPVDVPVDPTRSTIIHVKDTVCNQGFLARFDQYYEPFLDPTLRDQKIEVPNMAQHELARIMQGAAHGRIPK